MRLSEWRATAPGKDTAGPKVMAVVEAVLGTFGLDPDPSCWVAWGDDPQARWTLLAPAPAGLVTCHVRLNVPGEGPRASAKLARWNRVQTGELAVETQGGHRLVTFQVEGVVLRGADAEADRVGQFATVLFAAIDGRPLPSLDGPARRGGRGSAMAKTGSSRAGGATSGRTATSGRRPETGGRTPTRSSRTSG